MKLHLHKTPQRHLIQSCNKVAQGFSIKVNDKIYDTSILVCKDGITELDIRHFNQLTTQHFHQFAQKTATIFILGTGQNTHFPAKILTKPLLEKSIGLEVMANDSACRTYNLLMSDGREATLALLM